MTTANRKPSGRFARKQAPAVDVPVVRFDDVPLTQRFNLPAAFVPAGQELSPPDSYGFETGIFTNGGQSRGIATSGPAHRLTGG